MNTAHFEIKKGETGKYHYNLVAPNNEIIGTSKVVRTEFACRIGVSEVRTCSQDLGNFGRLISSANEPYFVLKNKDNTIILISEMYSSSAAMENGINAVIEYGSTMETIFKDESDA